MLSPLWSQTILATLESILVRKFTVKFSSYVLQYPILYCLLEMYSLTSQHSSRMHLYTDNSLRSSIEGLELNPYNITTYIHISTFKEWQPKYIFRQIHAIPSHPTDQTCPFWNSWAFKTATFITWTTGNYPHFMFPCIISNQLILKTNENYVWTKHKNVKLYKN